MRDLIQRFGGMALAAALLAALVTPAAAQAPETMVIDLNGTAEAEVYGGRLFVFADSVLCTTAEGVETQGVLGAEGQPAACSTPGAVVSFVNGVGLLFFETAVFQPGTTYTLLNSAPVPPHSIYPDYVCDFLATEGINRTECQAVGPAGPIGGTATTWRLGPRGIFADQRVVAAFVALLSQTGATGGLVYGDPEVAEWAPGIDEAPLLLAAAGVADSHEPPQRLNLAAVRGCLVWSPDALSSHAVAVAAEFALVLNNLGVDVEVCALTSDATAADLYVYDASNVPPVDFAAVLDDSFLAFQAPPPPSGGGTAAPVPGVPAPGDTGHGVPSEGNSTAAIALGVLALAVMLAARRLTARR